jgi:hypothetical protein
MSDEGRRRLSAATHRLMESYKDSYPSHARGICQEAIQNSVDARQNPQSFRDVTVTIQYDPAKRILRLRDYGTTGMSHCGACEWGIKPGTKADCHEPTCKWGNFHYLGGLAKSHDQLGSRGQGKSLAIVAGERFLVRTKLVGAENIAMASEWVRDGDEWSWKLIPDQAPKAEDKPGTELVIHGIIDAVHEQLLEAENIKQDIAATWFMVIEKGVTIRYGFAGKEMSKVAAPRWPEQQAGADGQPLTRKRSSIPVAVARKPVGELTELVIHLAEEPVPEHLRGIAMVRGGTQVIERIKDWGRKVPVEMQDRLFGRVVYFTSATTPFLNLCEQPSHRGYTPHPYYRRTHDLLQQQVEEFLLPLAKEQFKPRLTEKDRKRAEANLDIIRHALSEVEDFNPWAGEGISPRKPKERVPPTEPFISSIRLDKERYARGESAKVKIALRNPTTAHEPYLGLVVEALDPGMAPLIVREMAPEKMPTLEPVKDGEMDTRVCEVEFAITEDFPAGRNWVRCTLSRRVPNKDTQPTILDRGSHALWVEEDKPTRTRKTATSGAQGDGRQGTLQAIQPITDHPPGAELQEVFASGGEIWFFTRGPRIGPVYDKDARTADSILYGLVGEVILDLVVQKRMEDDVRDVLDKTQVIEEFKKVDEVRKRFLRACERGRNQKGAE